MLKKYKAIVDFLNVSKLAMPHDTYVSLQLAQMAHLTIFFANASPHLDDASATLAALAVATDAFSVDQRTELGNVIGKAVQAQTCPIDAHLGQSRQRAANQTHEHMSNYLTLNDWNTIRNTTSHESTRISTMVNACLRIGLRNPCERTTAAVVAILAATSQGQNATTSHQTLLEFKSHLKKLRAKQNSTIVKSLDAYPADVVACLAEIGNPFLDSDPPVPCPVDHSIIDNLSKTLPMRVTNAVIAGRKSANSPVIVAAPIAPAMPPMMEQMMQHMLAAVFGNKRTCDVQFLSPVRGTSAISLGSSDSDTPPPAPGQHLALTDGEVGQERSPPSGNEAASSRPQSLSEMIKAVQTGLATTKEQNAQARAEAKQAENETAKVNEAEHKHKPEAQPRAKRVNAQADVPVPKRGKGMKCTEDRPRLPALSKQSFIAYKGCKIYTAVAASAWRVLPKPGESLYDKKFPWGDKPKLQWDKLLEYCDNPKIPT